MLSTDNDELFEKYYQKEYDFNTALLSADEVADIKRFAKEKRVDYAQAPMGSNVFSWIAKQNKNIRFELVNFASEKIDGMLYIPAMGRERAYIVLNSNKPLINQIFTAAHEFYHYEKDYQIFKEKPYICDFSNLKDVNENRACRFAAELLLPEEALRHEIERWCYLANVSCVKELDFGQFAALSIYLTVEYGIPLKAVIYRLAEEKYIDNVDKYIKDYIFIKSVLFRVKIVEERVNELYDTDNKYVVSCGSTYQDMEKAFSTGNASREEILGDAKKLDLDMALVNDFLVENAEADDDIDDEELFAIINAKRG